MVLPSIKGRTSPFPAAASLPRQFAAMTSAQIEPDDDQVTASNLRHRDGWVIYNALRIRSSVDFDGLAAERLTLRSRISYLQQLQSVRPVHQASPGELQEAARQLQADIADMDARLAQSGTNAMDAIKETYASAQTIAKLLAATNTKTAGIMHFVGLERFAEPRLRRALDLLDNPTYAAPVLTALTTANTTHATH